MPIQANNTLTIFSLNVSQADSTIIISPEGNVIIIDAARPSKVVNLLKKLGLAKDEIIKELIITHPHSDHFSGANRLLKEYKVESVTLSPFWNSLGMGTPTYRTLINKVEELGIPVDFISGYGRIYPDGASTTDSSGDAFIDPDAFYIEMLGPPNGLISRLDTAGVFDTNHLSIISRLNWGKFSMVVAGDAQMENWAYFDQEGMLERCDILRASHHGSCHGTQLERLERLDPKYVIVSSNPEKSHHLPDLVGSAAFAKFSNDDSKKTVVITSATGSIRMTVDAQGKYTTDIFEDSDKENIELDDAKKLTWFSNPTDWETLVTEKTENLFS